MQAPSSAPKEAPPVKVEGPLSIPKIELKTDGIITPEAKAEKVIPSDNSYNTLVNTLTSHFDTVNKLKNKIPPETTTQLDDEFYTLFKSVYAGVDLNDADKLKTKAAEFLARGGAEVRLGIKLMQQELATEQIATGRFFVENTKGRETQRVAGDEMEVGLDITEDGSVTEDIHYTDPKKNILQKMNPFDKSGKVIVTRKKYLIRGSNNMEIGASNILLSDGQRNFMKEKGYTTGVMDAGKLKKLDTRMGSLVAALTELYLKTDAKLENFYPNLIKEDTSGSAVFGRNYIDNKIAHFIGETGTPGRVDVILEAEGVAAVSEVKAKVQKEIDERVKKESEQKLRKTTVEQLKQKIEDIKKRSNLTDAERQDKQRIIEIEIQQLEKEKGLFSRRDTLPAEIAEEKRKVKEAKDSLTQRRVEIGITASEDDLIKWSSPNSTETESWRSKQAEYNKLQKILAPRIARRDKLDGLINGLIDKNPALLGNVEEYDSSGVLQKVHKVDYSATGNLAVDTFKKLIAERDALDEQIQKEKWSKYSGDASHDRPLEELVEGLQQTYLDRKKIVEDDPTTKQIADTYHTADHQEKKKMAEKTQVDAEVATLKSLPKYIGKSEAEIRTIISDEIEVKKKVKEHIAEPSGKEKAEIQALEALIPLYEEAGKTARENRIAQLDRDMGELNTEYVQAWKDYPPALLRAIHLLWGEEVLLKDPKKDDMAANVNMLMRSAQYLDLVSLYFETKFITRAGYLANRAAVKSDDVYTTLADVYPAGSQMLAINPASVDRGIMEGMLKIFAKQSVNISTI